AELVAPWVAHYPNRSLAPADGPTGWHLELQGDVLRPLRCRFRGQGASVLWSLSSRWRAGGVRGFRSQEGVVGDRLYCCLDSKVLRLRRARRTRKQCLCRDHQRRLRSALNDYGESSWLVSVDKVPNDFVGKFLGASYGAPSRYDEPVVT